MITALDGDDGSVLETRTISLTNDEIVCFGTDTCTDANLKSVELDDSGSGDSEEEEPTVNL